MRIITTSEKKTARACPQRHKLEYLDGYRAATQAEVLRFGSLFHGGLEPWSLLYGQGERQLEAALQALAGEADPYERVKAEEMTRAYHYRWAEEPYDVLAVEVEFRTELRNPATGAASRTWRLGGKIDVVLRDRRDGLVRIMEHKTSSEDISPTGDYWKRLRMDGQVSDYFEGAKSLGFDVVGCIYDVSLKPAIRPSQIPVTDDAGVKIVLDASGQRVRTKDGKKFRETGDKELGYVLQTRPETPEEYRLRLVEAIAAEPDKYFARAEVARLEAELREAQFDSWQIAKTIREYQLAGRAPRNPDACVRFGQTCPFFPYCTGEASLDDTTLYRKIPDVHPELAGDVDEASPREVGAA